MHGDEALFGEPSVEEHPPAVSADEGLPDWQVAQLRERLDALGLVTMEDRQALIEELAGRPVPSLRHLTFAEARVIVEELSRRRATDAATGTAWDNRDEDTWIDRL